MDEVAGLKNDLASWIEKWSLLRENKLKYKTQIKKLLLRNQRLIKQNYGSPYVLRPVIKLTIHALS